MTKTIDGALHSNDADGAVCSNLPVALISSTQSSVEGSLTTNLKTKLLSFSDKIVYQAPGIHDHHVNVSKPVDLRKALNNKLPVGEVSAAVRLVASDDSIIKPSPEIVEALCLKHPMAPADIRQVPIPDIPYERDVSDTEIIEAPKTFRPSSNGGVDGHRPGHFKDLTSSSTAEAGRRLIKALASICTHVINGNVPPIVRHLLFTAKLSALRKNDGGILLEAVGNVLRRQA